MNYIAASYRRSRIYWNTLRYSLKTDRKVFFNTLAKWRKIHFNHRLVRLSSTTTSTNIKTLQYKAKAESISIDSVNNALTLGGLLMIWFSLFIALFKFIDFSSFVNFFFDLIRIVDSAGSIGSVEGYVVLVFNFYGLYEKVRTYSTSFNSDLFQQFQGKVKPVMKYTGLELTANFSDMIKAEKWKSGIYGIVNKVNGKMYVGSSADLGRRISTHFIGTNTYKSIIQNSISKNG